MRKGSVPVSPLARMAEMNDNFSALCRILLARMAPTWVYARTYHPMPRHDTLLSQISHAHRRPHYSTARYSPADVSTATARNIRLRHSVGDMRGPATGRPTAFPLEVRNRAKGPEPLDARYHGSYRRLPNAIVSLHPDKAEERSNTIPPKPDSVTMARPRHRHNPSA